MSLVLLYKLSLVFDVLKILTHRPSFFQSPRPPQTLVLYFSTTASNFYGVYRAAMLQGQVAFEIKLFCVVHHLGT